MRGRKRRPSFSKVSFSCFLEAEYSFICGSNMRPFNSSLSAPFQFLSSSVPPQFLSPSSVPFASLCTSAPLCIPCGLFLRLRPLSAICASAPLCIPCGLFLRDCGHSRLSAPQPLFSATSATLAPPCGPFGRGAIDGGTCRHRGPWAPSCRRRLRPSSSCACRQTASSGG